MFDAIWQLIFEVLVFGNAAGLRKWLSALVRI
jgi:hypothetical protein